MAVTINGTTGIITPDIGVDGTTLVVDAVNNRIGIGQSSPTTTLDVNGTGTISNRLNVGANDLNNRAVNAINASTTVGAVSANNHNANGILFQGYNTSVDANNASFVVESDGSTGIGVAVPTAKLSLATGSGTYALDLKGSAARQWGLHFTQTNWLQSTLRIDEFNSNGTWATRLSIHNGGNVGIGTADPAGTLTIYKSSNPYLYFQNSSSGTTGSDGFSMVYSGSDMYIANRENGILSYESPGGTERLRIDNVGSAQFTGQDSPSGRNTRISRYGSLLVATTGELISNARCAIDAGNGDIKTIGNVESSINTSTYQTGINLHTSSNLSTLTVYSNNSATHRSFVVYDNGQSVNADKYRAAIYANGNILGRRLFLGGSTNGGFDYNAIADTLEFLTTNGGTHSELNATAYVPSTNGGKHLGHHNKRWDNIFCNGIRFGGKNTVATTLDDYEEGAYVPRLFAGTGTTEPSYAWRYGQYVKIGEMVTVWGALGINGSLSTATQTYIGGLPFPQAFDHGAFFHYTQLHGYTWASGYGDSGSTTRIFLQSANSINDKLLLTQGSNKNHVTHAMIGNGQRFTFLFTYAAG
tara:strand:- start:783 stop:2537 length:1755 start_codon:yes stop_codon:yes gene_type:complete